MNVRVGGEFFCKDCDVAPTLLNEFPSHSRRDKDAERLSEARKPLIRNRTC